MSKYRSRPSSADGANPEQAELFVARNIATQLQNSSYGHFHRYLQHCGLGEQLLTLRLPRVIVVGGRSAGKSSLLESITKCPVFPRHRDFCTKAPIELRMKNDPAASERSVSITYHNRPTKHLKAAHEILDEVHAIMQGINGIDNKPVTIEICQADVPTFEVVDLPGIQTYPAEQEKATTQLVTTYLNKPNTLVLCVVDATTAAFDTSIALKLIRKAGKLSNTIVAMTKSDLVTQPEEYVHKIFDRILGQSSDNEHLRDLAGCVAVANRPARGDSLLADADAKECQVFARMLSDPDDAYASAEIQQQLKDSMTVQQLILQLDRMFHTYIVEHWKPAALKRITELVTTDLDHLAALGPPVEELTATEVFHTVMGQVMHGALCSEITTLLQRIGSSIWQPWEPETPLAKTLECVHPWGSIEWANNSASVRRLVQALLSMMSDVSNLAETLQEHFSHIFQQNLPPKLLRFVTLRLYITDQLVPAFAAKSIAGVKPKLERIAESILADMYTSRKPMSAEATAHMEYLDSTLAGCVISHFIEAMQDEADYPEIMQLPGTFHLEEVKEVQDERAELHDKINRLQTADSQISHIEDAFSTPGSPAAALAAAVTHAFGPAQPAQQHSADIVQTEASHPSPQDLPVSTKPSPVVVPAIAATPKGTVGTPPAPAATATGPADTSVPTATVPASATTVDSAATAPPATPTMPSAPAPKVTAAAASVKPVPSTAIAASAVQASATTAAVPAVSTTGTHRPAQIEAEMEEIPMSPASIADSFVHVE